MKKAIIIGASSGIGYELAVQLAKLNYQLGLMARRENLLLELTAKLPGEHYVEVVDLIDAERSEVQLQELLEKMHDYFVEIIFLWKYFNLNTLLFINQY